MRFNGLSRRRVLRAGPLSALLLAGCSVLSGQPYVETRRFTLNAVRPATLPRRVGGKVLLVRALNAAPGQQQRGLRTLRPDNSELVDPYNEWVSPPAELGEAALRRWLASCGLFAAVTAPGSRAPADLVLEAELSELIGVPAQGQARAGLSGVLLRQRGVTGETVLTQFALTGTAPLPADASPAALAAALGTAFAAALAQLERTLAPFA